VQGQAVDPIRFGQSKGLITACGLFLAAQSLASSSYLPGIKLGGRGLEVDGAGMEEDDDDDDDGAGLGGDVVGCACNSTYISRACCFSQEGLIWEEPEMKIGEVRRWDVDDISS
jgi:hypothetical protein